MISLATLEFNEFISMISWDIRTPRNVVLIEKPLFAGGLTALSSQALWSKSSPIRATVYFVNCLVIRDLQSVWAGTSIDHVWLAVCLKKGFIWEVSGQHRNFKVFPVGVGFYS